MAISMASSVLSLDLPKYTGLKTAQNDSILTVTFHNPSSPVNLWNDDTQNDLTDLVSRLQRDNETKVVIFNSDVPRLFVAHLDLSMPSLANRKFPMPIQSPVRESVLTKTQLISSKYLALWCTTYRGCHRSPSALSRAEHEALETNSLLPLTCGSPPRLIPRLGNPKSEAACFPVEEAVNSLRT